MLNLFRRTKPNWQVQDDEEKDIIRKEIISALNQFELIRFSTAYQQDIESLNEVIR